MSKKLDINVAKRPVVKVEGDEGIKDPMKPNKDKKKKKSTKAPMAPAWMLYRYNTCCDFIFMIIGLFGAILSGLGMPIFSLLF
jgi:quinol-cytochrome oxidoreductase complex cytochrome b subunit